MNKWKNKTEPIRDMDRKAKKKFKRGENYELGESIA